MAGAADTIHPRNESTLYIEVWVWLVLLLAAGLVIFILPVPKSAAVLLIFGIAAVKAALVARNYMHLKREHLLIYLIVLVPVIFFVGFALTLVPDIVYRHRLGF